MTITSERLQILRNQLKNASAIFKPLFYRINRPDEHTSFTKLLETPGIVVVDYILEQITEFVKLKSPQRRFSTDELKLETEIFIGKTDLNEYGVWVYYPWSNRLVHILDKEEFIEVRTSRNQYKITREERDTLATKKIGVIGLSVGQSVSVTLAMERICGELRLADFDILELTNMNRIRTGVHNLGLLKVYSVAREISEIDPYINVICFPEGLHENNLNEFFTKGGNLDLLVEESDGFDIKILSRFKARELKIPVIMEASDRCMVDIERFDLEPDRNILHGIVKHLDVETLKTLKTNEEKIPYMLDILGLSSTSPRLRASMLEMQQTISTWPQLGSAVTMGGGITADVSRRMLLNHFTDSGRYYVDIDQLIGNKESKDSTRVLTGPRTNSSELSLDEMKALAAAVKGESGSDINEKDLEKILEAGIAAPSYGNKQPWKFLFADKKLFLFKNSRLSFSDAGWQNQLVSIGACMENIILKAEELEYVVNCNLEASTLGKELLAVLSFKKNETKKTNSVGLSAFIFERKTNRKPGNGKRISPEILTDLSSFTKQIQGSALSFINDDEKINELAKIAGAIERIRLLNPQMNADYFKNEIRWPSSGKIIMEGIDTRTLEMPASMETAFEMISDPKVAALLNQWDKGGAFEKQVQQTISSSSVIGLVSMPSDSLIHIINGGRLAEKIWLCATKNSLAFQPICLPLSFFKLLGENKKYGTLSDKNLSEVKALKAHFSLIFNKLSTNEAVFLFRLSEADKPQGHSLRKPLKEVYFKS